MPKGAQLVGVKLDQNATDLETCEHQKRCEYLLDAEDNGLSKAAIAKCHYLVKFKSEKSLNVSVAGNIVLCDRGLNKPRS